MNGVAWISLRSLLMTSTALTSPGVCFENIRQRRHARRIWRDYVRGMVSR